jgi:predicted regulator of Ras-like GTPase activity (Roadblock/LC7/MglB family)
MATLPQLIEDDIDRINDALRELITSADATAALVIDKGGFLISSQGNTNEFDLTTIAALSSGAFMANQTIAGLVNEPNFSSVYQQGDTFSIFVVNIDTECMLVVIFKSLTGVGVVKYFASSAIKRIACQLEIASERAPGQGLDLSILNVAETGQFFRKKEA